MKDDKMKKTLEVERMRSCPKYSSMVQAARKDAAVSDIIPPMEDAPAPSRTSQDNGVLQAWINQTSGRIENLENQAEVEKKDRAILDRFLGSLDKFTNQDLVVTVKEQGEKIEDLERICRYQHALIIICLPASTEEEVELILGKAASGAKTELGKTAMEEILKKWED